MEEQDDILCEVCMNNTFRIRQGIYNKNFFSLLCLKCESIQTLIR